MRCYPFSLFLIALACASSPDEKPSVDSPAEKQPANTAATESLMPAAEVPEGEAWWLGEDDLASGRRHRFTAQVMSFKSGTAFIKLDSVVRLAAYPDSLFAMIDSIAITFNRRGLERIANRCRPRGAPGPIVGIVTDTMRNVSLRARAAWLIDTVVLRIRPVSPDSVRCTIPDGQ